MDPIWTEVVLPLPHILPLLLKEVVIKRFIKAKSNKFAIPGPKLKFKGFVTNIIEVYMPYNILNY